MIVLHAAWVPAAGSYPGRFAIWGEQAGTAGEAAPSPAPIVARAEAVAQAVLGLGVSMADVEWWQFAGRFPAHGEGGKDTRQTVPALCCAAPRANTLLGSMPVPAPESGVSFGDDLRFWVATAQLLARHANANQAGTDRQPSAGGAALPFVDALLQAMPPAAAGLAWEQTPAFQSPAAVLGDFARALAGSDFWDVAGAAGTTGADFRICFRLEPPPDEAPDGAPWHLRYLLQSLDDPSLLLPASFVWESGGRPAGLPQAVDALAGVLLQGLTQAGRLYAPLAESLRTGWPVSCALSVEDAYGFLAEIAPALAGRGFGVLVPNVRAELSLRALLAPRPSPAKEVGQGILTRESVARFDWRVALGEEEIAPEEFEALVRLKQPLVRVRGRWVELRPDEVEQALAFFRDRPASSQLRLSELLALALAPRDEQEAQDVPVEVVSTGWIDDLLRTLREPVAHRPVDEPPGFAGTLRPYQKTGVAWLAALRRHGLGACLADDMGLGKTVQLIALLLHQPRAELSGRHLPCLLICPTSVAGNWQRELARFAPGLRVLVHHGPERGREELPRVAGDYDVVISTYALLHRDAAALSAVEWGDVVLDEAQNVKNAQTHAARTARRLNAEWRAALTGTPVENRLSELWSLFQFLNPGYLGSAETYRKRFSTPIEQAHDRRAAARLKALVAPFILRRLKSDPAVIQDLPEKNEMAVYCPLTAEQATLYAAIARESLAEIGGSAGLRRRGLILAALTKLKQVCDHPALFLHDRSRLDRRSGKLDRLVEMLEEVVAAGDAALVFTQYAEMGHLLRDWLPARLGSEVLYLHGGTPAGERDRLVARFQEDGGAPRIFVLSLKAGGTGLNLTGASHVFHFDRWWNPAVETQATDRAYRIGQRRDVQVHTLLCAGTFEETLADLIARKEALAEAIVGTGEAWIAEMSTEQLRRLFALRDERRPSG